MFEQPALLHCVILHVRLIQCGFWGQIKCTHLNSNLGGCISVQPVLLLLQLIGFSAGISLLAGWLVRCASNETDRALMHLQGPGPGAHCFSLEKLGAAALKWSRSSRFLQGVNRSGIWGRCVQG